MGETRLADPHRVELAQRTLRSALGEGGSGTLEPSRPLRIAA